MAILGTVIGGDATSSLKYNDKTGIWQSATRKEIKVNALNKTSSNGLIDQLGHGGTSYPGRATGRLRVAWLETQDGISAADAVVRLFDAYDRFVLFFLQL